MSSLPRAAIELPLGRRCTGPCGQFRPLDSFYPDPKRRYGTHSECKECACARAQANRKKRLVANPDAERAKGRAWYQRNIAVERPRKATQKRAQTRARRAVGLCPWCGEPALPDRAACAVHMEAQRLANARQRVKRRAERRCMECGGHATIGGSGQRRQRKNVYCERCYVKKLCLGTVRVPALAPALYQKLVDQDFTCPYTGERLVLGANASIDHIKPRSRFPELRLSLDNMEWTTARINTMKHDLTKEEFLALVGRIAGYQSYGSVQPLFDLMAAV